MMVLLLIYNEIEFGAMQHLLQMVRRVDIFIYIPSLVGWISNFRFYFIYAFENWPVCQILYFFI